MAEQTSGHNWKSSVNFFSVKILQPKTFVFNNKSYGTLTISRRYKNSDSKTIIFDLKLEMANGEQLNNTCHITITNHDPGAYVTSYKASIGGYRASSPPMGAPTIGYGDINILNMSNMKIIYLIHYVFALTGVELGVKTFLVESIVNEKMNDICEACGMGFAFHQSSYQGSCDTVMQKSLDKAKGFGWNPA